MPSDRSDRNNNRIVAGSANQPIYVLWVTCKNHCLVSQRDYYNDGVNHIRRPSLGQQAPCSVRILLAEWHHHAPSQKAGCKIVVRKVPGFLKFCTNVCATYRKLATMCGSSPVNGDSFRLETRFEACFIGPWSNARLSAARRTTLPQLEVASAINK